MTSVAIFFYWNQMATIYKFSRYEILSQLAYSKLPDFSKFVSKPNI